jgi:hypothetical protein
MPLETEDVQSYARFPSPRAPPERRVVPRIATSRTGELAARQCYKIAT